MGKISNEEFMKIGEARNTLCGFCENTDFCEHCQVTLLYDQAEAEYNKADYTYWMGFNITEDFRILICAETEEEALALAADYANDAELDGEFVVSLCDDPSCYNFDCDYIIEDSEELRYIED